jgi:catechol 2,3-dioxygenase-like lactoylglutathione lyase family enzyme
MIKDVPLTGIFVNDQQSALDFYTNKLGLELIQDEPYGEGARWITVSPAEMRIRIVLKKAEKEHEKAMVGRSDGAPILTLGTDDIYAAYDRLTGRAVPRGTLPTPVGNRSFAPGPGRQPHPPAAGVGRTVSGRDTSLGTEVNMHGRDLRALDTPGR